MALRDFLPARGGKPWYDQIVAFADRVDYKLRADRPTRFADILAPASTALMPASRATVATLNAAPSWYTASPTMIYWDTAGAFTHSGPPTIYVPGNNDYGCLYYTGGGDTLKSADVEFQFAGERLLVRFFAGVANTDYRLWIDDQPVTAAPVLVSFAGHVYVEIVFPAYTVAKIRLAGPLAFIGVGVHQAAASVRQAPARFTIGVISDSYYEGNNSTFGDSPACQLRTQTGFRVWNMAQGGTGYINDAGGTGGRGPYGQAARKTLVQNAPINALLVNGSGNDGASSKATVKAAALAYYAAIAAVRPELPIVVVGVEPLNAFRTYTAINDGLREAAAEAPNVVGFIDPLTEGWLTGTGSQASAANNGNQDALIYTDGIHLSANGSRWYQALIAARLAPFATTTREAAA